MLAPSLFASFSLILEASALATTFSRVSKAADADDDFDFDNVNDISGADIYVATISINGHDFEVQLDTGSTDLWLDTANFDVSHLESTGLETSITYGDGTVAEGPIIVANVSIGDFTVPQVFVSAPGSNATTNNDTGLLGIGPPLLSATADALQGTQYNGKSLLENIFDANPSDPNIVTFLLSRSETSGTTDGGTFTIGEIPSNLTAINSASKLPVVSPDRWIVFMDNIIVNGKNVSGHSAFKVEGQGSGQTLANVDSGTGLAQIPSFYMNAIYGNVPGAQLVPSEGIYVIPCDAQIELSLVFGGVEYPIHPIDTVVAVPDDNGDVICISGFPAGEDDTEDFLLGDSFLRNVYSLYNFGSFISGTDAPFIQFLSTTDPTQANAEFSSLSSARNASILGEASSSGDSSSGSGDSNSSQRQRRASSFSLTAIIVGITALSFVL